MARPKSTHTSILFEELEPRLLFSADGAEVVAVEAVEQTIEEEPVIIVDLESEADEATISVEPTTEEENPQAANAAEPEENTSDQEETDSAENTNPSEESAIVAQIDQTAAEENTIVADSETEDTEESLPSELTESISSTELIFINDNVQEYELLISDIIDNNSPGNTLDIVILDSSQDGIQQVTDALAVRSELDAIHIMTHGNDGAITLGNDWLSNDELHENSDFISSWGDALNENADILLYGCNVAADDDGQYLTDTLSELTGADVASSNDLTGSSLLGGDWELEYQTGNIEAEVAVNQNTQLQWNRLLDITSGLIGHWTFDSDASDSSSSGFDGTLDNDAAIIGDHSVGTGSLSLDGADDYIDLSSYAATLGTLSEGTIAAWIKTTDTTNYQAIFGTADSTDSSPNQSYAAFGTYQGKLYFDVAEDGWFIFSAYTDAEVADGVWHHVAITVGAAGNSLYIDGNLIDPAAITYDLGDENSTVFLDGVTNADSVHIGVTAENTDHLMDFNGQIDDLRIYDRALSSTDISELFATSEFNTIVVTTTSDLLDGDTSSITGLYADMGADGEISLREAIEAANNTTNIDALTADQIHFNISTADSGYFDPDATPSSGDEYWVITPTSYYGDITDSVIIDATTQAGYTTTPVIELDGTNATGATAAFRLRTSDSTIRGFAIHSFEDEGVEIDGTETAGVADNNIIEYNWIGVDAEGNAESIGDDGVLITDGASSNTVRYNVISNSLGNGIDIRENLIAGTSHNEIYGNFIGTDTTGTFDMGNAVKGIQIEHSANNIIGGSLASERNIISGNDNDGIIIWGSGSTLNVVQGNYIGVDVTGNNPLGNSADGINISGGASNNTIGGDRTAGEGNVISGQIGASSDGVEIDNTGADNNKIYGNYIGTNYDGTTAIGNARSGVVIYDGVQGTEVGGTGTGEGNIISGNSSSGIIIDGNGLATTTANVIVGNYIGVAVNGTTDMGNAGTGIEIFGGAAGNTIGGTAAGAENVISRNTIGIRITGSGSDSNTVEGNIIGTDVSGTIDLGNDTDGIEISGGAQYNTIGGSTTAHRNLISGNDNDGIWITGVGTDNNTVQGNWIGVDAGGSALGNSYHGIGVQNGASDNLIGGADPGEGNTIANNAWDGISTNNSSTGNTFIGNSIYANGDLGIDIEDGIEDTNGVTANDANDGDSGTNNLQNYPIITQAELSGTDLTLSGTLDTDGLNSQYHIEFFGNANGTQDATNGEGQVYLDSISITTDGFGDGSFSAVTLTGVSLSAGDYVTAIATRIDDPAQVGLNDALAYGDSSEFAVNVAIVAVNTIPTAADSTVTTDEDTTYVFSASDFNFSDVDGDTLQKVQIISLPTIGALKLSGVDVILNQVIDVVDINLGNLTFIPIADENGAGYDSFEFKVSDGNSTGAVGTVLSSFAAPLVNSMSGLAFDGTNLWLVGQSTNTIYELDTAGNVLSSFTGPSSNPTGLTFDGTNLWLVDRDADTIYELTTTGSILSSFATPGSDSRGLTFDGTNLWLIEGTGSQIYELSTSGTTVSNFAWPDDYLRGIAWDGTNLWVTDQNDQLIYELNTSGTVLSNTAAPNTGAAGITFDGMDFWHADADTDNIYQIAGPNSIAYSASHTMTIDVTPVNDAPTFIGNTIGYWNFDEGSGDSVAESAIGISTGTLGSTVGADANDPTWTIGKFGQALQFDGIDDYVEIADAPELDISGPEFSASLWVKPDRGPGTEDMFFMKGDRQGIGNVNYYLSWKDTGELTTGKLTWAFKSDGGFEYLDMDVTLPTIDEWNHIAVVFDRPTVSIYINGTEYTSSVGTGGTSMDKDLVANDEPLWIGAGRDGGSIVTPGNFSAPFSGVIDELAIFDRALTDAEVEAIRTSTPPVVTASAFSIDENSANNTLVGTVVAYDQDIGDTLSYTIIAGNTGGAFSIDANGQIKVANSAALDFETNPVFNMTIEATDDGTPVKSDTTSVSISLNDVNDAPVARPDGVNLQFDSNDIVQIGDDPSLQMTDNVTMEAWINPTIGGTGSQLIVNKEGEYELGINADTGEIKFSIAEIGAPDHWDWHNTGHSVTSGEWTHVAVTYDGVAGEAKTYINGVLVETFAQSGAIGDVYTGFNDLSIGGRGNDSLERFDGQIDEVRVWSTTRTEGEIQANMYGLLSGAEPGLAGNWRLDEALGTTAYDNSLNNNHGTLGASEGAPATPAYAGYITNEDTLMVVTAASGLLANDSDAEGSPLTITNLDTTGMIGSLVLDLDDGRFTYDPRGVFETLDVGERFTETFTYTVNDGTQDSNTATVSITVIGAEDAPVLGGVATGSVTEDTDLTDNGTLTITDVDSSDNPISFNDIGPIAGNNGYGDFEISSNAWIYTLDNNNIDVQALNTGDTLTDTYTFAANDGSTQLVTITINGADDSPIITAGQSFTLSESSGNGFSLGNAVATDVDTGTTLSGWTITGGNIDGIFDIDAATGEITVLDNTNLDFDTTPSYTLSLQVSDGTNTSVVETVTINVTDVSTAITAGQSFSIAETDPNGTTVGTVATTGDTPKTFSITLGNTGSAFTIDNSGVITIADSSAIDYETLNSYTLTIEASDGTTPVTETVTITVTDVNENAVGPVTDSDGSADSVAENANIGNAVGITALATDPDGTDTVTYSLTDDAGGLFTIDTNTGIITVNAALDAETATSHTITVLATSTDTSTSSSNFTVTVTDIDEVDISAISDTDGAAETVAEDAGIGTAVGITALATDDDVDDNVTYSLTDDAGGLFTIDANTGIITTAAALDYESAVSHSVTVLATSDDASTSSRIFTISVTDVNDNAPVITAGQTFSVSESAANNFSLGNAVATDVDTATTLSGWTITGGNADGIFDIDGATGEITVLDNTNLDFDTTPSYTLNLTVSDGVNTSAVETVTINVSDVSTAITAGQSFSVTETDPNGTTVGTVVTTGDTPKTFSITLGNTGSAFTIDNSGVITIADSSAIDYETLNSYTLTIQASDGTTPVNETVIIAVTDVNENTVGPVTDSDGSADSVAENALVGDAVGITALATDPDGTDTVTYSLTDDAGGLFAIDSLTGVISVNAALDAETATSHTITVLATSTDTSTSSANFTVTVTDIDEVDISAIFDADGTAETVAEDAGIGTAVGITALATDDDVDDNVTYSLTDDAGGLFTIDANTGIITTAAALDYESAVSHSVTVLATSDDASTSSRIFTISVTDVNDNAPVITAGQTFSVSESAANNFSLGNAVATDVDTATTLSGWTITGGNADGIFDIDGATGEITVLDNTNLDFDTTPSYTLNLTVSDGVNTSAVETVTINVSDVSTAITAGQSFSVTETDPNGTTVGTVVTTGDTPKTFSITLGNTGSAFTIDNSGVITIADSSAIDYETLNSYTLTIQASDGTTPVNETVIIAVTDVNENTVGPVTDSDGSADSVAENALVGDAVGITALATDPDGTDTVTYSLTDDAGGLFAIDSLTGVISVNAALDAETATSHTITVLATSTDTSTSSANFTVTVTDIDEVDISAIFDADGTAETVAEDAGIGTAVGITALATDDDVDDNVTYSLTDDAGGLFTIDANTGIITTAAALDYESAVNHSVTVLATSDDASTSNRIFTISVTDVNDNTPVITAGQTFSVSESAANNFSLGNAVATDVDTATTLSGWTITGGNADGIFDIDAATGEITVLNNTNLDFDTTPSYTLSLTVSDGTNTSAVETVTINVTDVATAITAGQSFSVAETDPNGTTVGTVATTGDTPKTFSITLGNVGSAFSIDNSGVITIADSSAIDFETLNSYTLTIEASDGTTPVIETVTIAVTDVNENTVGPLTDSDGSADSVAENANIDDAVGITALANDPDGTDTVTYSLTDDAGGLFAIDANTGIITVNAALDAETATSHTITVLATSTDTSTSSANFTVTVTDIDEVDISAISDTDVAAETVAEDAGIGTAVGITALATDDDVDDTVTYSLTDDAGGLFTIDANTGVITTAAALDYESAVSHSVTVLATSDDTSTSSRIFTISVTDINDNAPVIASGQTFALSESAANGFSLGNAVATDVDTGTTLSGWTITGGNVDGIFDIDAATGEITVLDNTNLDFDTTPSYTLSLQVSDGANTSVVENVTINVTDVSTAITAGQSFSIAESDPNGTTVGTVVTTGDTPVSFSITLGNVGSAFTIDNSGIITIVDSSAIDYETLNSYTLTIEASDGTTPVTETVTISITDVNENSVGPVSDSDGATNSVAENALVGDTVGITALATDPDGGDTVTYSLTDDAGGLFDIDTNTGIITVNGALDAETATSHTITVLATSTDTSTSSANFTVTVTDVDEVDISGISDTDSAAETVAEDSGVGTAVGITALATDDDVDDNVTYSLTDDAGGLFTIDANTGVITTAAALDYESAVSHSVTVLATSDDTSTSSRIFTISVTDVNDNAPVITAGQTFALSESAANGFSLGNAVATDIDTATTLSGWTITGGNVDGIFDIDAATGEITVLNNTNLDFDTTPSYTLSLTVSDGTNTSAVENVTINVTDVSTAITAGQSFSVSETDPNGTTVGTVVTTGDTPVSFSITLGNVGSAFSIDNSGVINIADSSAIDYETLNSYTLTIQASDGTTPVNETVTISITDVNENSVGPVSDSDGAANSVAENALVGDTVGITALAADPDGTDTVTYTLTDDAGGLFSIDTNTGVISVNAALDAELATLHTITVLATSTDTSTSSAIFTVTVIDIDEVDISAISDLDALMEIVSEDLLVGSSVGITASATDADVDDDVTYSLSNDAGGLFTIDANSGVVTLANPLDYETGTGHTITVLATSDDTSTSSRNFTITVTDVNENSVGPVADSNGAANTVAENAIVGSTVGITTLATDPDGTDTVTYSLTNDAGGLFAIDAISGTITVANPLDFETATNHSVTVLATSSDTSTSNQIFTITITDVNEFAISPVTDSDGTLNLVAENSAAGTTVGLSALATDNDGTDTVTFSLTDDAGGRFTIDSTTGVITVAGALDFETAVNHSITILATSSDASTSSQSFTIAISDIDESSGTDPLPDPDPDPIPDPDPGPDPLPDPEPDPDPDIEPPPDDDGDPDPTDDDVPIDNYVPPLPESEPIPEEDDPVDPLPLDTTAVRALNSPETDSSIEEELSENAEEQYLGYLADFDQLSENQKNNGELKKQVIKHNYTTVLLKAFRAALHEASDFIISPVSASPIFMDSIDMDTVMENEPMRRQLSLMHQEMDESFEESAEQQKMVVYTVSGVSATFAAGVVSYLLRAGSLMSSFLATMPIWKGFDPVAILITPKKKDDKKTADPAAETPEKQAESLFGKE